MASTARALPPSPSEERPSPRKQLRMVSRAKLIIDRVVEKPDVPVEWPSPIGYALAELTFKQRHFAICVSSGMGPAAAYRRAYDVAEETAANVCASNGCTLIKNADTAKAIDLLNSWLDRQWLLESQEVVEYGYQRLYEEAENGPESADRTRATVALMKAHGAFVSRSEVKHIHVGENSASDQLIDAIGAMLGLAAAKASSREFITSDESKVIDVASEQVIESD